jgi:hypothetical protein
MQYGKTSSSVFNSGAIAAAATVMVAMTGCAGHMDYARPTAQAQPGSNVIVIAKSRDAVWATAVPELSKRFFVVNNLDKASGFINLSYSGDPEKYVDCGRVTSYVKNARGERTYEFAGSVAQKNYEVMNSNGLFFIDRRMALEGRVNLVFEEVSATETRVTANTHYVVTRHSTARAANNASGSSTDTIAFNSGSSSAFPVGTGQTVATQCTPTGALEQDILAAIK